jgi:DNA-directed RNA polymerase subunit K/omega
MSALLASASASASASAVPNITYDLLPNPGEDDDAESRELYQSDADEEEDTEDDDEDANHGTIENLGHDEDDNAMDTDDDDDDDDEDSVDPYSDTYYQKLHPQMRSTIIDQYHRDLVPMTNEQVSAMTQVIRDPEGNIVDAYHKTLPFITKYEKTRVLGERARQLEAGAAPLVAIEESLIDPYLIAVREYEAKKIPFVIKRPLPTGVCEYWRLQDLDSS